MASTTHHELIIQLGPDCWVDLEAGLILRDGHKVQLSAREVLLLAELDHARRTTRGFLSVQALVHLLGRTDSADPEHCIEQAISTLRRKLRETRRDPRIIRGRRGFGYRLYLADSPDRSTSSLELSSQISRVEEKDLQLEADQATLVSPSHLLLSRPQETAARARPAAASDRLVE